MDNETKNPSLRPLELRQHIILLGESLQRRRYPMKLKRSFRRWTLLLALLLLVPSQRALAVVFVDFSPDTTGAGVVVPNWIQCIGATCPNGTQYLGDKFTLPSPAIIDGGSIFSLAGFGSVGDPARFVILPDAGGFPGPVPVIDVSTTLDAVDTVHTGSQPILTRKHASIPQQLLPAGTYYFWMAGENVEIAQATGVYDDNFVYAGFDLNPDLELVGPGIGDTFFTIDRRTVPLPPICSAPGAAIPDPGSVTDTIYVTGTGQIADLDVYIDVPHTWVGDLDFTLDHVGGAGPVTIINRPGRPLGGPGLGCSRNDYLVTVNDEGPDGDIESQCDPAAPPAINGDRVGGDPAGPVLSAFDLEDLSGYWDLTITDNFSLDVGTLNQWCLIAEVAFETLQDCVNTVVELNCSDLPRRAKAACVQAAHDLCEPFFPEGPEMPSPPRR
jgi:hypothetical protein